ncbi:unnamed protein product [Rangifer tarandus platyrhynchus]|uniref:Uncharacterized protein n=2 Tax=Rangifer tarandus platyrhynchus TaxID=3082113 RepID=A0ACB0EM06_RANTA|nr:unnamed protein product [Rangifer tarandus platyrhynchus]CAI9701707.1 unnamed protein product [Rangifer tarandus platyrhynchus]
MERRVRSGLAHRLAAQTLLGTARRLLHKGQHPAPLRRDVRMPSGSTAIHRLPATGSTGQSRAVQTAVRSRVAVEAAICRPREISSGNGAGHSPQVTSPPLPPSPVPL